MKRLLVLLPLIAAPAVAHAQTASNPTPNWCSYQATGNPSCIQSAPDVANQIGQRVYQTNGYSQNQTADTPTINGGTSNNQTSNNPSIVGGSASQTAVSASSLTAPDGDHNGPASGYRLGYNQTQYLSPNPSFGGSATITGPQPRVNLQSIYGMASATFFLDNGNNVDIQSYATGSRVNVITTKGALQVQDTAASAAIWLVSSDNVIVPVTADTGGGLSLGNANTTTGSTTSLYLNFPNIRVGTTFITDTTKCGSVSGSTGCIPVQNSSGTSGYVPFIPGTN